MRDNGVNLSSKSRTLLPPLTRSPSLPEGGYRAFSALLPVSHLFYKCFGLCPCPCFNFSAKNITLLRQPFFQVSCAQHGGVLTKSKKRDIIKAQNAKGSVKILWIRTTATYLFGACAVQKQIIFDIRKAGLHARVWSFFVFLH